MALLAAVTSISTLLFALPVGRWTEFHAKRPAMVGADLLRFAALLSVPVAYLAGGLTFVQLCVVAGVNGVGQLIFLAASQANLVDLVSRPQLVDANGRLSASTWLSLSVGPAAGRASIITVATAVGTVLIDAVSYLGSVSRYCSSGSRNRRRRTGRPPSRGPANCCPGCGSCSAGRTAPAVAELGHLRRVYRLDRAAHQRPLPAGAALLDRAVRPGARAAVTGRIRRFPPDRSDGRPLRRAAHHALVRTAEGARIGSDPAGRTGLAGRAWCADWALPNCCSSAP